ncbi:MAG: tetratricopeptide repeat protein [Spirochaetia bacterium]|nr:tetratricopeptide repeat protein [Spirochaetota bacterium]MDW8112126.1 tetratricopeptide repeat protein [Spirochaetia bacterium]
MPSVKRYNEGSIIYFDKDIGSEVFLLKSGKVIIKYIAEDTNEEVSKVVRPGEIFGLKSAIISAPRGETAISAEVSEVILFDIKEFESFISNKPEILFKTLKALSNQLRNIGIKVNNLLSNNVIVRQDIGMFKIGEYFLMNKKYKQSIQVFERFLKSYQDSELSQDAKKRIQIAQKAIETGVVDKFTPIDESKIPLQSTASPRSLDLEINGTISSILNALSMAENNFQRGNLEQALNILEKISSLKEIPSQDLLEKALNIKAKCLSKLKKYDEAINTYKEILDKFPNSKNMKVSMFNMAIIFIEKGDKNNALMMLKKVASTPPFDEVSQKAKDVIAKISM